MMQTTANENAAGLRAQFHYHLGNDMIFDMILDFSYCLLSRISHVTLANRQKFGFEFYLRSSPSTFNTSGYG